MAKELTLEEAKALQGRDLKISTRLHKQISYLNNDIALWTERIDRARRERARIKLATLQENWAQLSYYLSEEEIDSLSSISPENLLGE